MQFLIIKDTFGVLLDKVMLYTGMPKLPHLKLR